LEAFRRRADESRRQVGIDRCLYALDAFLAPAGAAKGCGFTDADDAVDEAQLDDDVALGGDGQ
jgi:hypothetical protein